jgi:hypothetical protein
MYIMGKSGNAHDLDLQVDTDNVVRFYVATGTAVASTTKVQAGQWYHVAAAYRANDTLRVYVNGVREALLGISSVARTENTGAFSFGNSTVYQNRFWNGAIDQVRLYTRVLGDAEIVALASDGTTP